MNEIEYRLLKVEDITKYYDELVKIMDLVLKKNINQSFENNLSNHYVDQLPVFLQDKSAIVVGAFDKNKLVAFHWCYYFSLFNEKRVHSNFIGVLTDYQHRGIASEMLKYIEKTVKKQGIKIIDAMVTYDNIEAFEYHKKMGFEIERVRMKKVIK